MMSWRRLCFLALAVPLISGQGLSPTDGTHGEDSAGPLTSSTPPPTAESLNDTENNSSHTTLPPNESDNATDVTSAVTSAARPGTGSTSTPTASLASESEATVTVTTAGTSEMPVVPENRGSSSWGYVIMVLIFIIIIALCVILFFLRRVSRMYSFDLQFQDPDHFGGPTGTFEPVYLDDRAPNDQVTSGDPPTANDTSPQSEEKGSDGETAPQEQPHANGLDTPPLSFPAGPSAGEAPAGLTSDPQSGGNLFFDDPGGKRQNENNNNPSVCSSDSFMEINLDDPELCDQLLGSSEATSSVLPLSPFSFPTSS